MYRTALGLALCLALSDAVIQDCGTEDSVGTLVGASVANCVHDNNVCIPKRGQNTGITLQFEAAKDITKVNAFVYGVIGEAKMRYRGVEHDGCKNSGLACPLSRNGGTYTYQATLPVKSAYPKMELKVKWELEDEDGKNIVCAGIPVQIE